MGKEKKVRYDADGARRVMRKRDYLADFSGQFGLGLMANIVGQLTYFYTDKVGLAVGGVGVIMMIAKILDAFTDVIVGNIIDHSKGGNQKYYKWMIRLAVPAALAILLMFTVPIQAGQVPALIYALLTNVLLTAVLYTAIATPFSAIMIVRTNSQSERGTMGIFRAVGNYIAGTFMAILTIPVTNILGGTQSAWIKYGAAIALIALLMFLICYNNGRKAKFASDYAAAEENAAPIAEEEAVPLKDAMGMLIKNKYWVIVLLFNLITSIVSTVGASSGTYYCKWIFGNDNLVGIIGSFGLLATIAGFVLSKPIIALLGIKKTVQVGLLGAALMAGIRCIVPTNFQIYAATSLLGSFIQIPLMCLYGVLTAMTVDYNEWKYNKKMVAISGGAIGFGSKVGGGLGSVVLTIFLTLGAYDATLAVATPSMINAIYGFSNYFPMIINIVMFIIFLKFDLEKKLPQIRAEIAERNASK